MRHLGLLLIAILLISTPAMAGDRILEVQSRVSAALQGILDKREFLVVVNRVDSLESGGAQAVSGTIRNLPGLRVGVDEEGQVVLKEGAQGAYNGPVSVTVVLDKGVEGETYKAIEALLPEIMGGARGGDEVKLRRAMLKQPEEEEAPQVVVNNAPPQIDPKQLSNPNEFFKFAILFFFGLGALLWMMSRKQNENPRGRAPRSEPSAPPSNEEASRKPLNEAWNPSAFESFEPEVVGLYIMKCLHENDVVRARSFFSTASAVAQRNALASLPSWCAAYCVEKIETVDGAKDQNQVKPEAILRELTVMEKSLKDDAASKVTALILWIPVAAMEKVHPDNLATPTDATRYAIISMRPDLARSFKYDENDALVSGMVYNSKAMVDAGNELRAWKTKLVVARTAKSTVVDAMAGIINRAETFEEIDVKLRSIQKKMNKADWNALQARIVSLATFDELNELHKKNFLRLVEGSDFFFAVKHLQLLTDFPLEQLLRPKRLSAYRAAERMEIWESWTPEQQKESISRVLNHLRTAYLGENREGAETSDAA